MNPFERRLAKLEEIRVPSVPQCRVWVPPAQLTEAEQEAWCDAHIAAEPNGGKGAHHLRVMFVKAGSPRPADDLSPTD